ncbi:hypothetical protein NDU88_001368 [Pleurodeles waltl]|uniref:Uncharacterized protein n=1 Tax=Pleurodeles waltl TaxID=8319 RepID=A0AAV7WM83_PLEWA|nr:hypothetical protein NDU88_001368 [Pleurodeles waltl]
MSPLGPSEERWGADVVGWVVSEEVSLRCCMCDDRAEEDFETWVGLLNNIAHPETASTRSSWDGEGTDDTDGD